MKKGEITVFLSLFFVLLISFVTGVLEAAVVQTEKNMCRLKADRAVFSVFGEYQQELLEEYHVFALEGSYGTGDFSEENILRRMHYYGTEGMEHDTAGIQYLTDNKGQAFREQVTAYMEQRYGLSLAKNFVGMTEEWKEQSIEGEKMREQEKTVLEDYKNLTGTADQNSSEEQTPFSCLETIENAGILSIALPKDMKVSGREISPEKQVSYRNLRTGYGSFPARQGIAGPEEKILFNEYILQKFGHASESSEAGDTTDKTDKAVERKAPSLRYEVEYILAGKPSDKENLESVLFKIFLIRMSLNYICLLGEKSLKAQAEVMAVIISVVLLMPEIAEPLKHLILLAWAAGESIVDLRSLLSGNRVPLTKNSDNWQLPLGSLLLLGSGSDTVEGSDTQGGVSYEDYLRAFLFLENTDNVSMRTLDRIEENLISVHELEFFQADQCISRMEITTKASVTGGISYCFPVYFGYE